VTRFALQQAGVWRVLHALPALISAEPRVASFGAFDLGLPLSRYDEGGELDH
jgi:hypothetical protein